VNTSRRETSRDDEDENDMEEKFVERNCDEESDADVTDTETLPKRDDLLYFSIRVRQ